MSTTPPVVATTTPFATYAAALLPFAILVTTGLQAVLAHPGDLTIWIPFLILVAGGIASYVVKLLPTGWQGRVKVLVTLAAAILASLVPFVLPGGFDPNVDGTIIVNAVLQTIALALGIEIRLNPLTVTGARSLTTGKAPDLPKHLAR